MNPATDTDDIYDTCLDVLALVNEVYAEAGVELPAKQFLYAGATYPHDCEQVTLGFLQHYSGAPGNQAQEPSRCNEPRSVVLALEVVRDCTPTLQSPESTTTTTTGSTSPRRMSPRASMAPSVESLNADAKRKMADARLLLEAGMRAGDLGVIPKGAMGDVSAGEPNGMYQGMVLNIVLEVH